MSKKFLIWGMICLFWDEKFGGDWMFSWSRSQKIRSRLFCFSKRLRKESLGGVSAWRSWKKRPLQWSQISSWRKMNGSHWRMRGSFDTLMEAWFIKPSQGQIFVGVVSQFMQKPRIPHLDAAKRILRYVKGTLGFGLLYKRCDNFVLSGFTDADWAGNTNDCRST